MSERDILVQIAAELPHIQRDVKDTRVFVEKQVDILHENLCVCQKSHEKQLEEIRNELKGVRSWKDMVSGALALAYLLITTAFVKLFRFL